MHTVLITGIRTIPTALSFERSWRWCILATIRDLRLSVARGRTMSLPNTRRLFLRRFHDVCSQVGVSAESPMRARHAALGVEFLDQNYPTQAGRALT